MGPAILRIIVIAIIIFIIIITTTVKLTFLYLELYNGNDKKNIFFSVFEAVLLLNSIKENHVQPSLINSYAVH